MDLFSSVGGFVTTVIFIFNTLFSIFRKVIYDIDVIVESFKISKKKGRISEDFVAGEILNQDKISVFKEILI